MNNVLILLDNPDDWKPYCETKSILTQQTGDGDRNPHGPKSAGVVLSMDSEERDQK